MSLATRAALAASSLVLAAGAVLSAPAPHASAAGGAAARGALTFETIGRGEGATYGACKAPARGGWRVYARIDNRRSEVVHRGLLRHGGVVRRFGAVSPGELSPVRSVAVPAGGSFGYELSTARAGGGGRVPVAGLRRC